MIPVARRALAAAVALVFMLYDVTTWAASPAIGDLHIRVFTPTTSGDLRQASRYRYAMFLREEQLRTCLTNPTDASGGWWHFSVAFHTAGGRATALKLKGASGAVAICLLGEIGKIDLSSNPPPPADITLEFSFEP